MRNGVKWELYVEIKVKWRWRSRMRTFYRNQRRGILRQIRILHWEKRRWRMEMASNENESKVKAETQEVCIKIKEGGNYVKWELYIESIVCGIKWEFHIDVWLKNQCERHWVESALVIHQTGHNPEHFSSWGWWWWLSGDDDDDDADVFHDGGKDLPKVLEIPAAEMRKAAFWGWEENDNIWKAGQFNIFQDFYKT